VACLPGCRPGVRRPSAARPAWRRVHRDRLRQPLRRPAGAGRSWPNGRTEGGAGAV